MGPASRRQGVAFLLTAGCICLVSHRLWWPKWIRPEGLSRARHSSSPAVALVMATSDAESAATAGTSVCKDAYEASYGNFEEHLKKWAEASKNFKLVRALGKAMVKRENDALANFDTMADGADECEKLRTNLQIRLRQEALKVLFLQLLVAERLIGDDFREHLLREMEQRNRPLRIQEKLDMLQQAIAEYEADKEQLMPPWAGEQEKSNDWPAEASKVAVERRLAELSSTIETTKEGDMVKRLWESRRTQTAMNDQGKVAVGVKPSLHVMVRPEGLGVLQVYGSGPIGPPYNPAKVVIGIVNDGSMADMYREHPEVPLVKVQPNFDVDMRLR